MAITANAIEIVHDPVGGAEFYVSAYSTDISGGEDLVAAVAGKCHYVNKILVYAQAGTNITITIGAGQSSDVTTIYIGPIPLSDTGGVFMISFGKRYMKVAKGTALSIDSSAACPMTIYVEGKTV